MLAQPIFPYMLMIDAFVVPDRFTLESILDIINNFLYENYENSYIINQDYEYKIILDSGLQICKAVINIYKKNETTFIIEPHKLTSYTDGKAYFKMLHNLKYIFGVINKPYNELHLPIINSLQNHDYIYYEKEIEIEKTINQTTNMILKSNYVEQIECGINVLYYMANNNKLCQTLCNNVTTCATIIESIIKIINEDSTLFENAKHAAIKTLTKIVINNYHHDNQICTFLMNIIRQWQTTTPFMKPLYYKIYFYRECVIILRIINERNATTITIHDLEFILSSINDREIKENIKHISNNISLIV